MRLTNTQRTGNSGAFASLRQEQGKGRKEHLGELAMLDNTAIVDIMSICKVTYAHL
jgi:hypothetical protein